MNSLNAYAKTLQKADRYSPKNMRKPITFICMERQAKHVNLMGDFNEWHPKSHPLKRQIDGTWQIDVQLSHGHHHYLFSIDGEPKLDPRARGIARNEKNEKVSMIAVS